MTDATAAETPAAEETKGKKPKAEKAPKPQSRYWVGSTASREGAVYHRLQVAVAANPGLTRDELIEKLSSNGTFAAKNSKKFEENPKQFIGGYLTAGERKGFFTSDESKALEAPVVNVPTKKEAAEKGPSVTETGKALLNALKSGLGDGFTEGNGLPVKEVAESLGKTKSQLSRTIDKLVKEKMVETDVAKDGDEDVDYIYVTATGIQMVSGAAEAPAAE